MRITGLATCVLGTFVVLLLALTVVPIRLPTARADTPSGAPNTGVAVGAGVPPQTLARIIHAG